VVAQENERRRASYAQIPVQGEIFILDFLFWAKFNVGVIDTAKKEEKLEM
jgi:hypothetical protein